MTKRIDPALIPTTLKEAVTQGILGKLYENISGGGDKDIYVINSRPSLAFSSGFIEPAYVALNSSRIIDEAANPIHITTIGMDFQVDKSTKVNISVNPSFAIYVRVLPTSGDLKKHRARLRLSAYSKGLLRTERAKAIEVFNSESSNIALKEENIKLWRENRNNKISEITSHVISNVLGIQQTSEEIEPPDHDSETTMDDEDTILASALKEGESLDESIEQLSKPINPDELVINTNHDIEFVAFPGMSSIIPEDAVSPASPVQKWLRLDFSELPRFEFSIGDSDFDLDAAIDEASLRLNEAITQRLKKWLDDDNPEHGGKYWAYPKISGGLKLTPNEIRNWDKKLDDLRSEYHSNSDIELFSIPNPDIRWAIDTFHNYENSNTTSIRIALENSKTDPPSTPTLIEESIFQVGFDTALSKDSLVSLKLDRIKPSYRFNEYLSYPSMGFNNSVVSGEDGHNVTLHTTWIPIYSQPRIRPVHYAELDVSFDTLQTNDGTRALAKLPSLFESWIQDVSNSIDPSDGISDPATQQLENESFKNDINCWEKEKGKISLGIDLLCNSLDSTQKNEDSNLSIPYVAWKLMQQTMGKAASQKGFYTWHLFQLAFILANIPGLASRLPEFSSDYYDEEWDESVSLLYFATGGGKTESFFGLLVFNLFLDRLRGKNFGITALLRYPLRLLTTQQAQRLSVILATAEEIRWEANIGGKPFELGFWVGGSNTPNWRRSVRDIQIPNCTDKRTEATLSENYEYVKALQEWRKLPKCPFCKGEIVLRKYPNLNGLVGHSCLESKCSWNARHGGPLKTPLPFYIVDEDIYETAPSIILGTIDKLALIGNSPRTIRRFHGMFGVAPFVNKKNGMLATPLSPEDLGKFQQNDNLDKISTVFQSGSNDLFFDPFPSLIIQDETHLLEESLGTFAGVFETTFEHTLKTLGLLPGMCDVVAKSQVTGEPRMPKQIAASATVSEPERQMEALYQREVVQFPWPGPELYRSFYSEPLQPTGADETAREHLRTDEEKSYRARFYASIMTNGQPHTSATVRILAGFHVVITTLLSDLCHSSDEAHQRAKDNLTSSLIPSTHRDIYKQAIIGASTEELGTLVDLHRIALTYVTNKKGGDQIMAAETDTTARMHHQKGLSGFQGLAPKLISGAVSAAEIESVIDEAETRPSPGEELSDIYDDQIIRSVIATSAISHGVDVNELNSMFFAGMPSNASEYIQASSRVGRTHVGIIILIPTPQNRRDRYILETHDIYHRFLERLVKPAAVNRWAEKALLRTIPSLFQCYLIAIRENIALLNCPDGDKHKLRGLDSPQEIKLLVTRDTDIVFNDSLRQFTDDAIGLSSRFAPSAKEQFSNILAEEMINETKNEIVSEADNYASLDGFWSVQDQEDHERKHMPMTSLRDVDPAGNIIYRKMGSYSVNSNDARNLIRILSRGKKDI